MTYSSAVIRLRSGLAVLTGIALAGAPLPTFASGLAAGPDAAAPKADPATAAPDPAEGEAAPAEGETPPATGETPPAEGEVPPPAPGSDDEDPLAAKPEAPAKAEPAAPPPKPKKERRKPNFDPIGLGLALGGYALVVVSIGLAAGMGVRFGRGKNANEAVKATTTPDTEEMRMTAFANGKRANESARKFGIAAGVLFVIGVALVGTGHGLMARYKKRNKRAQLTPTFGPRSAGLSYRMSF